MAETKQERFPDYPIFKGLQRPLEFFGLQGRYIYWAAATARTSSTSPATKPKMQ